MAENEQQRPHLRVLSGGLDSASSTLELDVRNARRDLGRLLRGMQAAGHSVTRWRMDEVTRLAHFDSVTARYLLDGRGDAKDVRVALQGLRAVERWIEDGFTSSERAEVRSFELVIRLEETELHQPLLRPHHAPEEHSPEMQSQPFDSLRSLRAGLRTLDDETLGELGRRLGVPPFDDAGASRERLTETVVETLRDDHLMSILLATLDGQVQRVLLELVRGQLGPEDLDILAKPAPLALVVGGAPMRTRTPLETLRGCGLVFGSGRALWVPVELQPRIDGVLRGLGL